MENMIDDLIDALENLQEAKNILSKREERCLYDRSYFLSDEIEAVEKAKNKLATIFKQAVNAVVVDVINTKSYQPN